MKFFCKFTIFGYIDGQIAFNVEGTNPSYTDAESTANEILSKLAEGRKVTIWMLEKMR